MIDAAFDSIIAVSKRDHAPLPVKMLKLGEEFGELSEAVNHHIGNLRHKTMKEPLIGEVADVIQVVVDVGRKAYPHLNDDEFKALLVDAMITKSAKWSALLS